MAKNNNNKPSNNNNNKPSNNKDGSLRDQLKVAGGNGNISKGELSKISQSSGKDTDQIIRQLDKLNAKGAANNVAPMGLGSAAYNSLLKTPTSKTIMGKTMSELGLGDKYNNYGTGGIGQAIMQGKGTSDYYGNSTPGTGRIPQGQQVFGSFNGVPQLQIKPQNNINAGYYGAGPGTGGSTPTGSPTPASTNPVEASSEETTPVIPEKPEEAKAAIEGGVGSSGFSNTLGIKKRKSSWSAKGINSKGASSLGYNRTMSNGFF